MVSFTFYPSDFAYGEKLATGEERHIHKKSNLFGRYSIVESVRTSVSPYQKIISMRVRRRTVLWFIPAPESVLGEGDMLLLSFNV